uniref:Bestrophin homolog n=1 Tax=Acrobeloides nanus TaxID=290746 RepID=A0A914C228_9BILA
MMAFFVTFVVNRWKDIFNNIGFIDRVAFHIASSIRGGDEETTIVRRNIMRYLCLTQVMVLRDIAISVRKRFPNMDSLVDAGFLMEHEKSLMDNEKGTIQKYWMPINWVFNLCYDMRAKDKIIGDVLLNGVLQEVRNYRDSLQQLFNTDAVPVPLVYPQVVLLCTRVYFFLTIFSRQYILKGGTDNRDHFNEWVPLMTGLELIFLMGWLKVAEALLNPLGMDDDDFECNYIIDRNIEISTLMADKHWNNNPTQLRDHLDVNKLNAPVNKLIGSAALVTLVEENIRVKMIPHLGYTEDPKPRSRTRGFTNISSFLPRKRTNSMLSNGKGIDNPAAELDDVAAGKVSYKHFIHEETISTIEEDSPTSSNSLNH